MLQVLAANLGGDELSTLLVVLGFACLLGGAYAVWIRAFPVAIGLALMAVLCFFLAD